MTWLVLVGMLLLGENQDASFSTESGDSRGRVTWNAR